MFVTFVDLEKEYDSVPREAVWKVIKKLGVPEVMVGLMSFHQDMKARICLDGKLMDPITVPNGWRQGCCMTHVLFNLYTCAVTEKWLKKAHEAEEEVGVRVLYKYDGKLFRRYSRSAEGRVVSDGLFADDGALVSSTRNSAESANQ